MIMENRRFFSKSLLFVWLLVLLSVAVSKQLSGPKVYSVTSSVKFLDLCETDNSIECIKASHSGNVKTKGVCPPLPPATNTSDDDSISLQERLSNGITAMMSNKAAVGAGDKANFVMGLTGTGKSTVIQLLTGNLSKIFVTKYAGDFVIFDTDNIISLPTTKSKTLLPEFLVANDTGEVFVDCPGFNDNRGSETDIEAMYFLKAALDSVREAKFLFTVMFPSIDTGDKTTFDLLVQHAVTLIPKTNMISSAVALIVNKTPRLNGDGTLRTREDVLTKVKIFLEEYADDLRGDLKRAKTTSEKDFIQRKIDFVAILLSNLGEDQLPTKISYFRTPEACGALSELPEMLDTKKMLTSLYSGSVSFAAVHPKDFTITLKDSTLNDIRTEIIPNTTDQITNQTNIGVTKMKQNFWDKFYTDLDKEDATPSMVLNRVVDTLNLYIKRAQNATSFSHLLFDLFTDLQMNENEKLCITNKILELEKQLSFLEIVSSFHAQNPDFSWIALLEKANDEFKDFQLYYDFCQNLQRELGAYQKQVLLDKLQMQNKTHFSSTNVLDSLQENDITSVLPKIAELFKFTLRQKDKDYLVALVAAEIPEVNLTCETSSLSKTLYRLKVVGRRVRLSDIAKVSISRLSPRKWPAECTEISRVQQAVIFARDKVFFDVDLDLNCKGIHLAILTPEWEIVEASKVMLGCNKNAPYYTKDASPGESGASGLPGTDSGTFFGLLTSIINEENLRIVLDGGPGGTGQTGGYGTRGENGRDAMFEDFPSATYCNYDQPTCGNATQGQVIDGLIRINHGKVCDWIQCGWSEYFYMGGHHGYVGGDGSSGGDGGYPGKAGEAVLLYPREKKISFKVSQQPGVPGIGGQGGAGGRGGYNGRFLSCCCVNNVWTDCNKNPSNMTVNSGNRGRKGQDSPSPTERVPLGFLPSRLISEYKLILGITPTQFILDLDTQPRFIELQTPFSFAKDLVNIESVYYQERRRSMKQDQQYVRYYEITLSKIKTYAKLSAAKSSKIALTTSEKVALNYIYVTVLSKVVALRKNLMNAPKVINTQEYFQAVENKMADLQKEESSKVISEAISKESAKYKATLNTKIQEAHDHIEKFVLPSINTTESTLDELNDKLVNEINEWLSRAEQNEQELEHMKRRMEASLPLRGIFGVMKIIGVAAQFFGPIGMVAGTAIGAIAGVASDLTIDNERPSEKSFDLPFAFYSELQHHSKKYYEDKIKTLTTQVNLTKQACNEGGSELADLATVAAETETVLEEFRNMVKNWKDKPENIFKKEKEMNDKQRKLAEKIEEKAKEKTRKRISNLNTAFKLLGAGLDLFQDLAAASQDLEKLDELIKGAEEKIQAIELKKSAVYEDFIPLLEEAMHDIRAAGKSLDNQTLVGLSVKRWRVQGMLQDMQNTITTFTNGLQVEPEFLACVDTLSRAINLLIELYAHIERYEEKKELADYMANIHRVPNPIDQITDPELKKAVTDLEFLVHLNIFLHDYHVAMGAFKQWAFPFASKYLVPDSEEDLDLMELLGMNRTTALEQTLASYVNKVKRLGTQLLEYQSTTERGDGILIAAKFLDGLVSMRPFVVWSNEQWRSLIRNLLSGKTIQLKADMDADAQMAQWYRVMTAVKFKCIRIRLRTSDPNTQQDLDSILNNFHMRMVHSGISEYRAVGHKYVMYDSNQTLRYSFEEVGNEPVAWNVVKEKICRDGDYLMSPFTWWTLTLLPANPSVPHSKFDELVKRFGNQVNLDLEGDGLYLDEANAEHGQLDDLKLDQFYKAVNDSSLSEFGSQPTGNCGQGYNKRKPTRGQKETLTDVSCPRGENWMCFEERVSRDKVCNDLQWVKQWKDNLSGFSVCYCCQQ